MRSLASATVSIALLLCVSCADRPTLGPCVSQPRPEFDEQLLNLDREVLNSVRLDFAFEGTFEEGVYQAIWKGFGPGVILPTPYPEQTWREAPVKVAVTDAGLYDILAELGRQARIIGPVVLRNDQGDPRGTLTYVRPLLSPGEAARLPEHALEAVRKEMNHLAELNRSILAVRPAGAEVDPVGPKYRYTAILCARPPALVRLILKEMDRGGDEEKGCGAIFLRELFIHDYKTYMRSQYFRLIIQAEPPFTAEEIEQARKEAVAYLSALLAKIPTGTVALCAQSALEAIRDRPEPAESN